MGCQAGAGGEAGRADSRAVAPWPPHLPCRRAARRDERRVPPWQLQRAQRALQARRRRMTSGGRRHSATSGCSRWRSARRPPAARRAGTRATRATRASARRGAMQRAGGQPAPCDRHPCVERRGASHAGPPRAAAPQGGQVRSERVAARARGACAARRPAGGDAARGPQWRARASRRGGRCGVTARRAWRAQHSETGWKRAQAGQVVVWGRTGTGRRVWAGAGGPKVARSVRPALGVASRDLACLRNG